MFETIETATDAAPDLGLTVCLSLTKRTLVLWVNYAF